MHRVHILLMAIHVYGYVDINTNMKSFSHAKKAAHCYAGKEITVYEHNTGPGVLTEQWFAGAICFDERTMVRYYIDGDAAPTIEANLLMMHGVGFKDVALPPWGTKWIGHTALSGGLYNTYRIPFQHSIRIAFISQGDGYYWYIVRGAENYPVIIGDLQLPSNAKLVLHKIENKTFLPYAYIPLVVTSKAGMLFSVALRGQSINFLWLEGCFGTVITMDNKTEVNHLSSGTEDFFLSAFYYNKGLFQTDDSGLTYYKYPGTMSAYKFFHSDPVLMRGNFSLLWRVGEKNSDQDCWHESATQDYMEYEPGFDKGHDIDPQPTKITSYVWTYEWS